jgi:cell shape-determining protein MreD
MTREAKGFIVVGFAVWLFLLLQTTFLASCLPKPEGVLAIVLAVAFLRGPIDGGIVGFVSGLFEDALSGMSHGAFGLTYTLLGLSMGFLFKRLNSDNVLVVFVGGMLGSFLEFWLFKLMALFLGFFSNLLPQPFFWSWILLEGFLSLGFFLIFRAWFLPESSKALSQTKANFSLVNKSKIWWGF